MARLFFGMEVFCPWPDEFPSGDRHLTLAFLGDTNMPDLHSFPKPPFSIGVAGFFNKPLKLAHVIAWHVQWLQKGIDEYQKELTAWLGIKDRFLPHVTITRNLDWQHDFQPLPLYVQNINLYESLGHSKYKILWQYPMLAPFEEIEHTADIAFIVRGNLYLHAQLALAFHYPQMIRYFDFQKIDGFDEIVTALNQILARVDSEIGCPFKAVSFHGEKTPLGEWEMIVDV